MKQTLLMKLQDADAEDEELYDDKEDSARVTIYDSLKDTENDLLDLLEQIVSLNDKVYVALFYKAIDTEAKSETKYEKSQNLRGVVNNIQRNKKRIFREFIRLKSAIESELFSNTTKGEKGN